MFWFKPQTIHVDCFVSNATVYNNFRIDQASKFYPDPIKTYPKKIDVKASQDPSSKLVSNVPTIKMCNGITDLFANGFILPAWHQFSIEMTDQGNCILASAGSHFQAVMVENHPRVQYGDSLYQGYTHAKLISPWLVKEKSGVKFTWNMCDWHRTDNAQNVRTLSAVVDYKYQVYTNVNMFIRNGSIVSYEAGDPLAHMIPISDKRVKLHHHLIDVEDWHRMRIEYELHSSYPNHRKLKYNDSKCPFGFSK
jgi:hypothetical protein